jgi:hypothetical protein
VTNQQDNCILLGRNGRNEWKIELGVARDLPGEWVMAFAPRSSRFTTVNAFFDESGKFQDHNVISLGAVVGYSEHVNNFSETWARLLFRNGLKELTSKNVLNARRPLSSKNARVGAKERTEDLLPFIDCMRRNLDVITGITIDVRAFKKLPSHFFQSFGNDPIYVAFMRSILGVLEFTPDNDKISLVCDDDEKTALVFYRLYRRIKKVWPQARKKLVAISFANDSNLFCLQAADFVASLMRLEAGRKMAHARYDYGELYKALSRKPDRSENLWQVGIALGTMSVLLDLANSLKDEAKKRESPK